MRACLVFTCLLAATFALSVKSKPHGKHHGSHKTSHTTKEKDVITEEANDLQVLPTLVMSEAGSSQEQADEELSSEDNTNAKKEDEVVTGKRDKSTAVLLSEEQLVDLLKKEAQDEEEAEERELDEKEKAGQASLETEEELKNEEEVRDDDVEDKVEEEIEKIPFEEKPDVTMGDKEETVAFLEETESSTESELPTDLDYAADSGIIQPLQIVSSEVKPHSDDTISGKDDSDFKKKETSENELHTSDDYHHQGMQATEARYSEDGPAQLKTRSQGMGINKKDSETQEVKSNGGLESDSTSSRKNEEESKNDSGINSKGKTRKQKKNQRQRKHSPQRDERHPGQQQRQDLQESEDSSIENTAQKAKRRRAGKWGPLVGVNPVQIRATVDLYPGSSFSGSTDLPENPADPCDNFRCKRGKTCKLDADGKPGCVCQEPSECPTSINEYDHVCGTDNRTYDTSCELFATKCKLEGTKTGHKFHLDYTGPCKLIPPCLDTELIQFPLRMRDWLKNVLLQLYEHDSVSPGYLTPKQRFRVKKIFENERRLHAGDHSVELLALDFEKNYNMYIYPVHWQFAQLDQHPSDRMLTHSELAPLRVPLVPMEHCTSRFFQECDADKDKQVSFKEWTSCFGIRNDDMDPNLLF
ncbi:SPARC-like protein 1 [Cololabis saira]|uniref:SPARC-like protein 1 n=1 Tax=Cololabis saira TaxID=129043 RepID=UPI002AD38097|nr:SPARC-like protein 1 [Cololabis saira]